MSPLYTAVVRICFLFFSQKKEEACEAINFCFTDPVPLR
jgi:hypothetical protein